MYLFFSSASIFFLIPPKLGLAQKLRFFSTQNKNRHQAEAIYKETRNRMKVINYDLKIEEKLTL